jgi:hypothetical protein
MSRIHIPGLLRWRCVICDAPTDQRHHAAYKGDFRRDDDGLDAWCLVPLCDLHHAHLHRCWDALSHGVQLPLFTLQYVVNPHVIAVRALKTTQPPAVQLGFGDLLGPAGEHWRDLERQWRQLEVEFPRDDHLAA